MSIGICKYNYSVVLNAKLDATMRKQQAGFRANRSCVDKIKKKKKLNNLKCNLKTEKLLFCLNLQYIF